MERSICLCEGTDERRGIDNESVSSSGHGHHHVSHTQIDRDDEQY